MAYVRKTEDEYRIYQDFGCGFEEIDCVETRKELKERLKEYRENQPEYPLRWRCVRVRL